MGFFNRDFIRLGNQYINSSFTTDSSITISHTNCKDELFVTISIVGVKSHQTSAGVNAVAADRIRSHTTNAVTDIVTVTRDRIKIKVERVTFSDWNGNVATVRK